MRISPAKGAVLIKTDGTISQFFPKNRKTFTLDEAQTLVCGYIEVLHLPAGHILILNEDGKSLGLPYNDRATVVAKGMWVLRGSDYIAGDAVLCPADMLP